MSRTVAIVLIVAAAAVLVGGAAVWAQEHGHAAVTTKPATTQPATSTQPAAVAVVNTKCPISGEKIDSAKAPASLVVTYKDQKVGFCCPACPPAWAKLSDADKDAKLAKAK